jgi:hypothetical protein
MVKPMQRKNVVPFGARLSKGMPVQMDDGWRGRVDEDHGGFIVCTGIDGDPMVNYRAFSRRLLTVSVGKALVNWKSVAALHARPRSKTRVARQQTAVVLDLDRARIEREWQDAPAY